MPSREGVGSWIRIVDSILDGESHARSVVRLGPTPLILQTCGLGPNDLVIVPGKIVKVARDHPEITRKIWHQLPNLLASPVAVVPSARRDGSIVTILALRSELPGPVLVPIIADFGRKCCAVTL